MHVVYIITGRTCLHYTMYDIQLYCGTHVSYRLCLIKVWREFLVRIGSTPGDNATSLEQHTFIVGCIL